MRVDQQRAARAGHLRHRAEIGGQDRAAAGLGLNDGNAKTFEIRHVHRSQRSCIKPGQLGIGHAAGEMHGRLVAHLLVGFEDGAGFPGFAAHDEQLYIGGGGAMGSFELVECPEQVAQILARLQSPNEQKIRLPVAELPPDFALRRRRLGLE